MCSRSWPQARNAPGVCNYSLSTAAHLASFKSLRPSQNRHTSPSSKRYLTSSGEAALRPRSLLFTSHLVPVTQWSEFCLASTSVGRVSELLLSEVFRHDESPAQSGGAGLQKWSRQYRGSLNRSQLQLKWRERSSGCGCSFHHGRSLSPTYSVFVLRSIATSRSAL